MSNDVRTSRGVIYRAPVSGKHGYAFALTPEGTIHIPHAVCAKNRLTTRNLGEIWEVVHQPPYKEGDARCAVAARQIDGHLVLGRHSAYEFDELDADLLGAIARLQSEIIALKVRLSELEGR